jgi:hypothetical protein
MRSGEGDAPVLKIVELVGSIAAPVTVFTALLYYFGWVRTNAIFRYFGVDPAILAFGLPEYLSRSVGTAFKPTVILLLVSALVVLAGRTVDVLERWWPGVRVVIRGRHLTVRPVASLLLLGGLVSAIAGVAVAVGLATRPPPIWAAFALALGGLAAWHGARHVSSRRDLPRRSSFVERALLFGVVATALFWATAAYSQQIGDQLARFIDSNPASQPEVTIHSAEDLNLWSAPTTAPGQGKFPYTYRGFRLLIYANERWFLLTREVTPQGRHRVVVVPDDDSIRVDLSA